MHTPWACLILSAELKRDLITRRVNEERMGTCSSGGQRAFGHSNMTQSLRAKLDGVWQHRVLESQKATQQNSCWSERVNQHKRQLALRGSTAGLWEHNNNQSAKQNIDIKLQNKDKKEAALRVILCAFSFFPSTSFSYWERVGGERENQNIHSIWKYWIIITISLK